MKIFKSAILRLTFVYVLIVMVISITFSIVLYQISSVELGRGLGRQVRILRELEGVNRPPFLPNLENIREQQFAESSERLKLRLIYFNLLILLLSAGVSYLMARHSLQPIEEAMEAQDRFTADASHELKTPLTAMRTEIEVSLRDKKMDISAAKKLLKSNLEEIGRLESLSGALLKLSMLRDDAKKDFEELSLSQIINDAYARVESLATEKEIKFENKIEDVAITGGEKSLTELFVIILDNAIKYSHEKSKISITLKKKRKYAIALIADQGPGIKKKDLPHIFDRFYQADGSRCKKNDCGYGLGLSIAKEIVELHGGKIMVKSNLGAGSVFKLIFRRAV